MIEKAGSTEAFIDRIDRGAMSEEAVHVRHEAAPETKSTDHSGAAISDTRVGQMA